MFDVVSKGTERLLLTSVPFAFLFCLQVLCLPARNSKRYDKSAVVIFEEIVVVTGPNGFSGGKLHGDHYWTAAIGLVAWKNVALALNEVQQSDGQLAVEVELP